MTGGAFTAAQRNAVAAAEAVETARQFGLSLGDHWVQPNAEAAARMFNGSGVKAMAAIMAAAHPYAIDYIQQAPVLVLAVANGEANPKRRHLILTQWKAIMDRGEKLKRILAFWGLPQPMRQLRGRPLNFARWRNVKILARDVSASSLAQIIPPKNQERWWLVMDNWIDNFRQRNLRDANIFPIPHLDWIGRMAPHSDLRVTPGRAADMADFVFANIGTFDPRVTWEQAQAAETAWHAKLAKLNGTDKVVIDPDPLPRRWTYGEFEFVALCSEAELVEEGRRMHHCVGGAGYWSMVKQGMARIVSVRLGQKHFATVEVLRNVEIVDSYNHKIMTDQRAYIPSWQFRQIRGPANSNIDTPTYYAINAFRGMLRESGVKITK